MKFIKESSRSTQTIDIFFILHVTVKIPFTRRSGYDQELLTHYKFLLICQCYYCNIPVFTLRQT
jgi:hypothetical protein